MPARTWKGLMREINRRIENSLAEDVYPVVKEKMLEHIISDVHSQGRKTSGGLEDESNIEKSKIGKGRIIIMDVAVPDTSYFGTPFNPSDKTTFSRWINEKGLGEVGGWMDFGEFIRTGNKVMRDSRPFIGNTISDLKSNKQLILDALKKGIEGRK